jgi:phage terminase small subunit
MAGVKGQSGGRNAKSTRLHLLQGTTRRGRHDDDQTAEAPAGTPRRPKALRGPAGDEWDRMVARLGNTGALSSVDDAALYQYASLFAETEQIAKDHVAVRRLSTELKRLARRLEGQALVDAIGEIVKLQAVLAKHTQQLRQGHMAIRQYLVEFGMTPSARTRVKLPPSAKASTSDAEARRRKFFGLPGGSPDTSA